MPDFHRFHELLARELQALQDRVRLLVSNHWETDGNHKEAILRAVLKRHLPETLSVGSGFVVDDGLESTQIDILIVDRSKPVLFREGDLMIVTPDAVRGVIEVKTSIRSPGELTDAARKPGFVAGICGMQRLEKPWTGLFSYSDTGPANPDTLLDALFQAREQCGCQINCVTWGLNYLMRHWYAGQLEEEATKGDFWRLYHLPQLAPTYFVGNALQSLADRPQKFASFAWFPLREGNERHGMATRFAEDWARQRRIDTNHSYGETFK